MAIDSKKYFSILAAKIIVALIAHYTGRENVFNLAQPLKVYNTHAPLLKNL
jgi:hypothetical protein